MELEDWLGPENSLGISIWKNKYQSNNETFDTWLDRVSGGDEDIKQLIKDKKFLFGGRILANRGLKNGGTLSNCFVTTVKDSIESIYDCAKTMAETYKAGGGIGVDISNLSPSGARINNAAKTTSGAVSFIELFTTTTGLISQNGRRAALMISISCDHPDIEEFIKLKTDVNKATTANLSIRVSDEFMRAVENDENWHCSFTRPETGETMGKNFKAKELFKTFCDANYDYGEPGLLFWDRIESHHLQSEYPTFKYDSVNPCAEEPLPDGGSCLLGSINLSAYVTDDLGFDMTMFKHDVEICIRGLNDVQREGTATLPLFEQRETAKEWRQIGLGVMGLGDMLIKMNIRYGSPQSITLVEDIAKNMLTSAVEASHKYADEHGAFSKFSEGHTKRSQFYKTNLKGVDVSNLANSQLLTIPPTGTISTMIGVSGGMEPLFALEYDRKTKSLHGEDVTYKVVPDVVKKAQEDGLTNGLVCSADIHYMDRLAMQSAWQKYIDGAISSTINLPHDFPREKVADLYINAWKMGLKGVTVYRDGCAREGILTTTKKDDTHVVDVEDGELIGLKRKLMTGCGSLHVTAFFDKKTGALRETFLNRGSQGLCANNLIGVSRLMSLSARAGCTLDQIVDQLKSCGTCPSYAVRRATKGDTSLGACCPSAIGNALIEMSAEAHESISEGKVPVSLKNVAKPKEKIVNPCPQCGGELAFTGGCNTCPSCGWTKCA